MELTQKDNDAARRAPATAGSEPMREDSTGFDFPPVTAGRYA